MDRGKLILRASVAGIAANLLLAAGKAMVGLISGSIAIVLDAVNNLSDVLSSVITIVGARLAGRRPDKEHPLGHGRVEYLSASVIALVILYAGLTSAIEAVKKLLHPEAATYEIPLLAFIVVAIMVKIVLGLWVGKTGQRARSDALVASGRDALLDALVSAGTLGAALLALGTGISIEPWVGLLISGLIIKSGVEMLSETISKILGERAAPELTKEIKKTICEIPEFRGVYDLFVHDYGPELKLASCHVEVPDVMTADQLDRLTREAQQLVYERHGVILEAVGVYSVNTQGDGVARVREEVTRLVTSEPYVLQMHGFYLYPEQKKATFDVIIDFAAPDRGAVYQTVAEKVKKAFPDYDFQIAMDLDSSD